LPDIRHRITQRGDAVAPFPPTPYAGRGGTIALHLVLLLMLLLDAGNALAQTKGKDGGRVFPILGSAYERVRLKDHALRGCVFYILAGHGGPDSGARGEKDGHTLCEDEYAYDVALRLTRGLLEHDALVYVIVRDPDDGIRDSELLDCDSDETVLGGEAIPREHAYRLEQRARIVNRLHRRHADVRYARMLEIHVDSRDHGNRIDLFFYHHSGNAATRRTAETLRGTIARKYDKHQPWRGYQGTVAARDGLYMLRKTNPPAVYIELGNIQSASDHRRLLLPDNRQAMADWLVAGLLRDASQ